MVCLVMVLQGEHLSDHIVRYDAAELIPFLQRLLMVGRIQVS